MADNTYCLGRLQNFTWRFHFKNASEIPQAPPYTSFASRLFQIPPIPLKIRSQFELRKMSKILLVGIGNVGTAFANVLHGAGGDRKLSIWNRTTERPQVKSLVEKGIKLEKDLVQGITNNDVIIVILLDYPALFTAMKPFSSQLAGKTVINITNGTPNEAIEAEKWLRSSNVGKYFDGAMMGTPQMVGSQHSLLIFSGEMEASFKKDAESVMSPLGTLLYLGEAISTANTTDLAALAAMYSMFSGAFIGIGLLKKQLAKSGGKQVSSIVDRVVLPFLSALVPYVGQIAKAVEEEAWDDNLGNPIAMQLAGVQSILKACKDDGVNGTGLETLAKLMQKAIDGRGGDGGVAEVARFITE